MVRNPSARTYCISWIAFFLFFNSNRFLAICFLWLAWSSSELIIFLVFWKNCDRFCDKILRLFYQLFMTFYDFYDLGTPWYTYFIYNMYEFFSFLKLEILAVLTIYIFKWNQFIQKKKILFSILLNWANFYFSRNSR